MSTTPASPTPHPTRHDDLRRRLPGQTLTVRLAALIEADIDAGSLRAGQRLPSIRQLAEREGVSFSTAVATFEKLVALGRVEARRGSGFYVRTVPGAPLRTGPTAWVPPRSIDAAWLARSLRGHSASTLPGSGLLPKDWLDERLLAQGVRAVGRQQLATLVRYGDPLGWLPLRAQLQIKLADIGIGANPAQIVVTHGVTHAIELVIGTLLRAGDIVLADDPGWFTLFDKLRMRNVRVVAVPWQADGPDLAALEQLARTHRPKLFITQAVQHNPTGGTISPSKAHRLLRLAELWDFLVLENDVFGDLAPPGTTRIAALDQLQRVIFASAFSKTLSGGLRVGYLACNEMLVEPLADQKLALGLTTCELGERVIQHVLSEGQYRRHVMRLRARLDRVRAAGLPKLESLGLAFGAHPCDGIFAWVDTGRDTAALAARAADDMVLAPGQLFSPVLADSTWMRLNIGVTSQPALMNRLRKLLA